MNISTSMLIKSSLTQLVYLYKKKQNKPVSKAQIDGNKHAEKVSKGLAQELRGCITKEKYKLYFCLDAIENNTAIEIKNVNDMNDYPDWYLNNSLLQTSLYFTMLNKVKYLDTPKFRIKEGFDNVFYDLTESPITNFELWFGTDKYQVSTSNKVLEFYKNKAKLFSELVILDWDNALYHSKKYDFKYKFKEWDLLKQSIKYNKLTN